MNVLVCGATGFVGRTITLALLGAGHTVRALTRSVPGASRTLGSQPGAHSALQNGKLLLVEADVTEAATLPPVVSGVDAIVQAAQFKGAPVEDPSRRLTYDAVDRQGTENLLGSLSAQSLKPLFLYMSGITVDERAREPWNAAKYKAEQAIRESGLPWTIVRSCWAYGPGDKALNRILGYSDYLPFVAVFGGGHKSLSPVYVEDIGRLFVRALQEPDSGRETMFRLGGPDNVSLDDFLAAALKHMGRYRPTLHIPLPLAKASAALLQSLPGRPLTPDAVEFVAQGGEVTEDDRQFLRERFPGYETTPLREGLASYLGRRPA